MLESLGEAAYALVTTYRKDGTAVPTPVWIVRDENALAFWTPTRSAKIKRLRRSGTVMVGPCDVRGNPLGDQVPGHATILNAQQTEHVRDLLRKKYRIWGRLILAGSILRRGRAGTVGVRIRLT